MKETQRVAILTGLFLGLRVGELLSLKAKTSNRTIAISDGLCELLVRHLFTLQNTTWPNPENLLFPSTAGTYIDPKSYEIRLSAVSKRCEIKKVNPRALRHMCASTKLDLIR